MIKMDEEKGFIFALVLVIVSITLVFSIQFYQMNNLHSEKCPEKGYVYHSVFGFFEECRFDKEVYELEILGFNSTMEVSYNG